MEAVGMIWKCRLVSSRASLIPKLAFSGFCQQTVRLTSSATHAQESNLRTVFRTNVDDPRQHTIDHEGLFYRIADEDINTVFDKSIHSWHNRLMRTFNEPCVMVRKPAVELYSYIKNVNLNHPVPRFVLYGQRGAGKRNILAHVMHACYRDNWIIVHVPWAGLWVRGWKKEVTESMYKPGRYDIPSDGALWLTHFQTQNQGKLSELKTTSEYIWTKREKAEIGTPLEEIIKFGLNRVKFSSDCVGVVLKELRQQAQTNGLKILVAVSNVNAFFVEWNCTNSLKNSEKKKIQPNEVTLIHNFKKMLSPTWTHGVAVCTVDESCIMRNQRTNYTPLHLLGKEGFEALDPFVPILVPEYSEKEARSTIDYYIDRNWIQNEHGKTEEGKKEIMFVSNRNPFELYKVCSAL